VSGFGHSKEKLKKMEDKTKYPFPEISLKNVEEAAARIKKFAKLTPIHTSETVDSLAGKEVFFKCEIFQKVFCIVNLFVDWCI
jgi:hypothetical protein